jgi:hypothetical protein
VDGVDAAAGASVLADRAAGSRGSLRRGVADLVAGAGAAALEDVVEAEPVADFVGGGGALVVGGGGAAGQGVGQVDAAVEGEVGGGRAGGGEVAPAEGLVSLGLREMILLMMARQTYHPRVPPGMSVAKYRSSSL